MSFELASDHPLYAHLAPHDVPVRVSHQDWPAAGVITSIECFGTVIETGQEQQNSSTLDPPAFDVDGGGKYCGCAGNGPTPFYCMVLLPREPR